MYQPQADKFSLNEKENISENMEKFTLKVSANIGRDAVRLISMTVLRGKYYCVIPCV